MQILQMRRRSVRLQSTALFLLMAAVAWWPCCAFAQTFKSFDFPGAVNTQATAINDSGEIVGRFSKANGRLHGFKLVRGVFTSIDYPDAVFTDVTWVNDQGNIVGAYQLGTGGFHGFLLSSGKFTTIDYAGLANNFANGISRTGEIVGVGYDSAGINFIGFLLKDGKFSPVAFPGSDIVLQEPSMLEEGKIIGRYDTNVAPHGYLLDEGGTCFQTVECPDTKGIYLTGIDVHGRMVGAEITPDGHQHGLLINGGVCHPVDFPDSDSSYASGINTQGDIVGRYTDKENHTHAFIVTNFIK